MATCNRYREAPSERECSDRRERGTVVQKGGRLDCQHLNKRRL